MIQRTLNPQSTVMRREPISTSLLIGSAVMGGVSAARGQKAARRERDNAQREQDKQMALIAQEKANLKAVADGQAAAAQTGGGGLLAYVDDETRQGLRSKLGGA